MWDTFLLDSVARSPPRKSKFTANPPEEERHSQARARTRPVLPGVHRSLPQDTAPRPGLLREQGGPSTLPSTAQRGSGSETSSKGWGGRRSSGPVCPHCAAMWDEPQNHGAQ